MVPRHGIGQQVQRTPSGSTPHDRFTILQICPSRSLPLHRPRQSMLRYPAVDANRPPTGSVQRHLQLIREPLPLRPTRWTGSIPITHRIRGIQIPIANAAPSTFPLPRFPPWEVCGRRPRYAWRHHHGGRHPQTFTGRDKAESGTNSGSEGGHFYLNRKSQRSSPRTSVLVRTSFS